MSMAVAVEETTILSEAQASSLLRLARRELSRRLGLPVPALPEEPEGPGPRFDKVNVTLRRRGELRASMGASGETLPRAVQAAVRRAVADHRFGGPLVAGELPSLSIELLVQTGSDRLGNDLDEIRRSLVLGVHGAEVRQGERWAYYKPSVALTSALSTHEELLGKLCRKAGLPPDAWHDPATEVRRTHWLHWAEAPGGGALELLRLRRRVPPALRPESLAAAAGACARHLMALQRADGTYNYLYNVQRDTMDNARYNLIRFAGCAYAMAWAADALEAGLARRAAASAERALRHLLSLARPMPGTADGLFIPLGQEGKKERRGKLGAVALALLALQFGRLGDLFAGERRRLLAALLSLQREDGSFQCHVHRPNDSETSHDFYPGEALLALCRAARRDGDPVLLAAVARAFPFYREHFRSQPATAFVLWQVDAWRLFHETVTALPAAARPAGLAAPDEYAAFVCEQVDWLLGLQHLPGRTPCEDWVGGFPRPGRPQVASATYTEAVIRACGLAHRMRDTARFERYRGAARLGLTFLSRLQIDAGEALLFPRPELAAGGVTAHPGSFVTRNDWAQHLLTASLAALETPELLAP